MSAILGFTHGITSEEIQFGAIGIKIDSISAFTPKSAE